MTHGHVARFQSRSESFVLASCILSMEVLLLRNALARLDVDLGAQILSQRFVDLEVWLSLQAQHFNLEAQTSSSISRLLWL